MKYTPDEIAALLANRPNQPHYVKALIGKCVKAAVLAEREACIAAIQAQIDHAHINELRLTPRFGRRHGEIAVRADDLGATLDGIRARGQQ